MSVLRRLAEIDPRDLLPPDESATKVLALSGKRLELVARLDGLKAEYLTGGIPIKMLGDLARDLESPLADIDRKLTEARTRAAAPLASAWGEAGNPLEAIKDGQTRVRLRAFLRRVIDRINCLFVTGEWNKYAQVEVVFKGGGIRQYTIAHRPKSRSRPAVTVS